MNLPHPWKMEEGREGGGEGEENEAVMARKSE